jgi:coenzyme F420-reducing hydrogenase beta subunit
VTTALLEEAVRSGMVDSYMAGPPGSHYTFQFRAVGHMAKYTKPGVRYATVALPCQVEAMREILPQLPRIQLPLVLGLFCSHRVEEEGVRMLLRAKGLDPDENVLFRFKSQGRTGMLAGDLFIPLTEYWGKFLNYAFIPKACLKCKDLCNEQADVSLGDAHHIRPHANLVIVRTEAGERLVDSAIKSGAVRLEWIPPSEVVRSQQYLRVKKAPDMRARGYKKLRGLGNRLSHSPMRGLWRLGLWRVKSE